MATSAAKDIDFPAVFRRDERFPGIFAKDGFYERMRLSEAMAIYIWSFGPIATLKGELSSA